jgi:plastocyanin
VRVDIGGEAFKPADIRIGTGDTVLWVWSGPDLDHTVTADPGQADQFDSDPGRTPNHELDDSFAHRFTKTGTYSYLCRRHPDQMKGTITVVKLQGLGDTKRPRLTRVRVESKQRRIPSKGASRSGSARARSSSPASSAAREAGGARLGISTSSPAKAETAPACRCGGSHRVAPACA